MWTPAFVKNDIVQKHLGSHVCGFSYTNYAPCYQQPLPRGFWVEFQTRLLASCATDRRLMHSTPAAPPPGLVSTFLALARRGPHKRDGSLGFSAFTTRFLVEVTAHGTNFWLPAPCPPPRSVPNSVGSQLRRSTYQVLFFAKIFLTFGVRLYRR